jgi:hypothetical protein
VDDAVVARVGDHEADLVAREPAGLRRLVRFELRRQLEVQRPELEWLGVFD